MTYSKEQRESYSWLTPQSRKFLSNGYLKEGQSAEERILDIAMVAESILKIDGFAEKFEHYMSKGYYSLSSPVWSNFGLERGLPISCFGSYLEDNTASILYTGAEVGVMSKMGGGTSGYFGALRGRGTPIKDNGESNGSFPFARIFDNTVDIISQGTTRRGQFAGYIDIEHPDVEEWLEIQLEGNPIQLMFYGLCVGDEWMKEMIDGDRKKRKVWAKVIQCRSEIGSPYIFFKDTVNRNTSEVYKENGATIYASNLCSEIALPSNKDESFVCCLSSMNLLHYDEWKDTDAVEILTYFLDAVISEFITKLEFMRDNDDDGELTFMFMKRAHRFASRHRAIGIGALGWHSLLQSRHIAFDSMEAMMMNARVFSFIQSKTKQASQQLAQLLGEPEVCKGTGYRNTTQMAIAPTKSSSFILGQVSQGIEPFLSNYFVQDLAKIKDTYRNPYLVDLLKLKDLNTPEVWSSILVRDGSVQHLEGLTDHERDVFKTFSEISQLSIIQQAAQRQQFIDQSQSLNLMVHPNTPTKDVNALHIKAWEMGVKTLYYQNSVNAAQELNRNLLNCSSCEG
jgi:ribonucleoside-diphosphate reductase alpha chain